MPSATTRKRPNRAHRKGPASPAKPAAARAAAPPSMDHAARVQRLRAAMTARDLAWFLVTNPLDVAYLTGFLGGDSYLLVGPTDNTIISDFRYEEELAPVRALAAIHIRKGSMPAAVAEVLAGKGVDRCAIQPEVVTLNERDALARAVGEGRTLVPVAGLVAPLRLIKDAAEIAAIRHAVRIQEAALKAVLPTIRPGQTELEVAARLEAEMKTRGSREPGFQTIVAARANGSLPHYRPNRTTLARNQPVLIDWGAVHLGYHGDMTRTFTLGKWPAKVKEIYQIVLEAQLAAAAALAPGKSTKDIDAVARGIITRAGYGEAFGHGLGHGLGFNGHEEPRLTHMLAETTLQVGQVVTVEPGIYLPGIGGVRIEDDYVITPNGAENLCTLPKTLDWSTL